MNLKRTSHTPATGLVLSLMAALIPVGCAPGMEPADLSNTPPPAQASLTIAPDGSSYVADFELAARGLLAGVAKDPAAFSR